jgi:tetratricopeptide (TPR) repeat protein
VQRGRPKVRIPKGFLLTSVLLACFLVIGSISCAGFHKKTIHIPISEKDIQLAKEAQRDGDTAFSNKDYYAALIKYLKAVRYNPDDAYLNNSLGIAYAQMKYYDDARKCFERTIRLNPTLSFGFNNLGSVYFLQKKLKKAEVNFKKAIGLDANEASFHINLGSVYLEKKKLPKALSEWRQALSLDPQAFSKSNAVNLRGAGRSSPGERSYLIAALYASEKKVNLAIDLLKQAFADGFSDIEAIEKNSNFNPIRQDPLFIEFSKNMSQFIKPRNKVDLPEGPADVLPYK